MYKVMIVEDDPMVADINRQYVEMNPNFLVSRMVRNGKEGLDFLKSFPVDLIILDYYMPIMDGREFVRQLLKSDQHPEVIMVTAANEAETVHQLLDCGVLDYLVKPFEYHRFEQALARFIHKRELRAEAGKSLSQQEVDRMLGGANHTETASVRMQKGMQQHTLETIRRYMSDNQEKAFRSEEIAAQVKLSRVTVRRYLNYMTETHEIVSSVDYQTGGRPSIIYRHIGAPRNS